MGCRGSKERIIPISEGTDLEREIGEALASTAAGPWARLCELVRTGPLRKQDREFLWSGLGEAMSPRSVDLSLEGQVPDSSRYTILGDVFRRSPRYTGPASSTFPLHPTFRSRERSGRRPHLEDLHGAHLALYSVLMRYAVVDPGVGYCQGQNFVAGFALINGPGGEAGALGIMRFLLQRCGLRELYVQGLPLSQALVAALQTELLARDPALHGHLLSMGLIGDAYALQWFMSLFTAESVCTHECAAAVWDVVICDAMLAMQRQPSPPSPARSAQAPVERGSSAAVAAANGTAAPAPEGTNGAGRDAATAAAPSPAPGGKEEGGGARKPSRARRDASPSFRHASLAQEVFTRAQCTPACAAAADVLLEAALAMLAANRRALLRGREPAALQDILLGSQEKGPHMVHPLSVLSRLR